jgi:hypothetical protein
MAETRTREPRKRGKGSDRIGRVEAGPDGAAKFVEGAEPPKRGSFDPQTVAEGLGMWWKSGAGNTFVLGSESGGWSVWPEQGITDLMREEHCVAIKAREDERLSESKRTFLWVRRNRCLDEVFPALPGYRSGVHRLDSGERVLVKTQPNLLTPAEGEWPTLRAVIEGLLSTGKEGLDQTDYFYSWCKVAHESLRDGEPGNWRPGHAVIFAGPRGAGKSLLQTKIVTPLLGGREADPQKFLFGTDDFNGDCFAAEHLNLGEVPSSQKTVDRIALAETIKQIVATPLARMRLMRTEPWSVHPYWRLTISLNDDPDKLRSLPPISADYGDKVLIFHTKRTPLPMRTQTLEERRAFSEALSSEMPAFLHWLLHEWEIPGELLTYKDGSDATRFGFREYHHPLVKDGLFDETPAAELMMLIDMADFEHEGAKGLKLWDLPSPAGSTAGVDGRVWHGPAVALERILTGQGGFPCSIDTQARELLRHNRLPILLQRLNSNPDIAGLRLEKGNTRAWKGWKIGCPI